MARTNKIKPVVQVGGKDADTRKARGSKARGSKVIKQVTNPDTIVSNINAQGGAYIVVTNRAGESYSYPRNADRKDLRDMGAVGNSYSAFIKHIKDNPLIKPRALMARGAEGKMTEHSRKAIADQPPKASAAKTASGPKAAKAKQPSRGADRDYTRGETAIAAKSDSWRHHMLTMITKHSNTAKAKAAHEKSGKFSSNKLDFNWAAAQGYIVWAK